ncbi:MAG: KGGVGR-motif variant AAA ATPase [Syntrophobacteraceae bacterium]
MKKIAHVTTFYSFKGGVGRTLLLANVGVCLALKGRKVLLWDLDVEAPGMHFIPEFTPQPAASRGFLEWLLEWQDKRGMPLPPGSSALSELYRCVQAVFRIPGLSILPAFGEKADSARLYQDILWQQFLVDDPAKGLELFRSIIEFLGEKGGYDHILIDARTGVTDLGGLMTAVLPHATVLVANYGAQNLKGIAQIEEALRPSFENRSRARAMAGRDQRLESLLVISPVPGDQELSREARRRAYDQIFPMRAETRIEIPFDSRLLFTEQLLSLEDPESKAARGYAGVAERIEQFRVELLASREDAREAEMAYAGIEMDGRGGTVRQLKKGQAFEDRVARLLTLLGYRVEREQLVDGNRVDLIASGQEGLARACYLVECKDHAKPVGKSILESFRTWLDGDNAKQRRAKGLVVARGFSPAAIAYAKSREGLSLFTIEELENELFNFGPYLARIRRAFEESGLGRTYVEQRVMLEESREVAKGAELLSYAMSWATRAEGRRLWLLLGDYGTGKTTFFKRFAYELARAQEDPERRDKGYPVPIAIDLKEFPNAITLEGLLQEHMRKHMDWHGNPEILLYLLEQGKVVFLFDAFDEMGAAAIGRSVEDQFRQLAAPAGRESLFGGNRVLITCRTHFFRDQQVVKDVLQGAADDLVSRESALGKLARTFDAQMDELRLFDDAQIDDFLRKHLSENDAVRARSFIDRTYDLPRLAPRPVLLEMMVGSLPELMRAGGDVTPGGLYHRYTSHWLDERAGGSLHTTPQQRKLLLEFLARELWGRPQNHIHHRELIGVIENVPSEQLAGLDLDRVDLELRTAAFLIRTNDGFYSFSHRSFLEFFMARCILRALRDNDDALADVLATAPITPECISFLFDLLDGEGDWNRCKTVLPAILSAPYRMGTSENALRLAYRLAGNKVRKVERKNESGFGGFISDEMALLMPERARLQGAMLAGEYLSGAWLMRADLEGADLEKCDLSYAVADGAIFKRAKMDGAVLDHARCHGADFSGTSLRWASGRFADFDRASFDGADLTAAVFVDTQCPRTSFKGARCHAARFARSELWEAEWEGADITRFTAPDAIPKAPGRPLPANPEPFLCFGHTLRVNSAVFSPDDKRVLTASVDGAARILDAETGEEILILRGHEGWVNSGFFSPDGQRALTAGEDGTARIWDAMTGLEVLQLRGHGASVISAAFSLDGKRIVTAGADGASIIWDAKTGREFLSLKGHVGHVHSAVFSPDGSRVLTTGEDNTVRIWDSMTGREDTSVRLILGMVYSAVFLSDGERVLVGGSDGAQILDVKTGHIILVLKDDRESIKTAVFSPDESMVLTAGMGRTASIWDAKTGFKLLNLESLGATVSSAVFSSDGKRILAARWEVVHVCDSATGKNTIISDGHSSHRPFPNKALHTGPVVSAAFSPDGTKVMTAGSGIVRIWGATSGRELIAFENYDEWVGCAAFSPDGKLVAMAGSNGISCIRDAETGVEIFALRGHEDIVASIAFSSDGRCVLTAGRHETAHIWDAKTGREILIIRVHGAEINSADIAHDASRVLTGLQDGTIRIFDAKNGREILVLRGHGGTVLSALFSPDGKRVLTGSTDGTARMWDGKTGREVLVLRTRQYTAMSADFSPDGKRIVTAGDDGTVSIWGAKTGELLLRLKAHDGGLTYAIFSHDGRMIITAGEDRTARIWDAQSGEPIRTLLHLPDGWLTLDAQGRYLGEGSGPAYLSYFDPEELSLLRTLWHAEDLPQMRAG